MKKALRDARLSTELNPDSGNKGLYKDAEIYIARVSSLPYNV